MQRSPPVRNRLVLACLLGGLTLSARPDEPGVGDAKEELTQIEKELRSEYKQLIEAVREIDDPETRQEMFDDYSNSILPEYLERMALIARAHKGTDEGGEAWGRILRQATQASGPSAVSREALVTLTTDHIGSETLAGTCSVLRYGAASLGEEPVLEALQTIEAKSPHSGVRAKALFALGAVLGEERTEGDPRLGRANEVFQRVIAEYSGEEGLDGRPCGEAARAFLFSMNNLRVGQACPDFKAVDAEGAAFQLADYKGKVVLVDFWGFW